jgi:uncharacterized protein YuzE
MSAGPEMSSQQMTVDVTLDNKTGRVMAAYIHVRPGRAARSRVMNDGLVVADYNAAGQLIGVEMLGPCRAEVFDSIRIEKRVKNFIRRAAPAELIPA